MKLTFSTSLLAFFAVVTSTYATQVSFNGSAANLKLFKQDGATALVNGDLYWIGTFSTPGGVVFNSGQSIQANIAAIESAGGWNQFTLDTSTGQANAGITVTDTINGLNRLSGTFNDGSTGPTSADFFNGKAIYVWIFDTSSTSTADQMGIFTASLGSPNPAWIFPSNELTPPANQVQLNVASGTMAPVGGAGTVGTGMDLVSATPEPSTLTALFGGAGLLGMIRRRSKK